MRPLVNFMPWRRQKRRRCIRFWLFVSLSTTLAITLGGLLWRASAADELRSARLWQQSNSAVLEGLIASEQPVRLRLEQWQQAQARIQRREWTQAWQQTLLNLAQDLPLNAWLTQLSWRQNRLELSGVARSTGALSELEQRLQKSERFHLQPMGATTRDAEGHWQFHYQLTREQNDVVQQ